MGGIGHGETVGERDRRRGGVKVSGVWRFSGRHASRRAKGTLKAVGVRGG